MEIDDDSHNGEERNTGVRCEEPIAQMPFIDIMPEVPVSGELRAAALFPPSCTPISL
jgi:hypothetical protein